jgi:UDP-glucose 4-epimerase
VKVVVTGAAGPRGRQLVRALVDADHRVVGTDTDTWNAPPPGVTVHRLDHRKRGFEELMRQEKPDAIVHLAVHAGFRLAPAERHRLNLEGTTKIIGLAATHGVHKVVVASHASVYGALADNPYFMTEEYPPRVGQTVPEMQDLVTADLLASNFMWQHPEIAIVVLRPVHALGPTSRGVLATLLRREWVPTVLGYDPMVQIIHEDDVARAFTAALTDGVRGVFNVTGAGELPLSVLIEEAGCTNRPVPELAFKLLRGRFGLPEVASGAVDFIKHPCLIDGTKFREATGFAPKRGLRETARSMRH